MDLQHLNRTIEENPIANGLDIFYSFAKQKGFGDIAAVEQIIAKGEWADIDPAGQSAGVNSFADVRFLATELVSVTTGMVGEDSARRLLKAAITKADDKTLWEEVLAFITASLTATTRSIAPQNTPPASTSTAALASIPTISITHDDDLFAATIPSGPADSNCPDTP
ncbi:uncharacterized protein CPUR_04679 [Claviceps purpurea 20.1]|uniref:Uncharacterized protein n=1 Tax=Claviceps purpurea (strain 20.1) TaxID=1111077 RepID=M1W722_CLAP2|nr:uncharacterized protein CPUR_04679 [Claviceps purpurea 20.1]